MYSTFKKQSKVQNNFSVGERVIINKNFIGESRFTGKIVVITERKNIFLGHDIYTVIYNDEKINVCDVEIDKIPMVEMLDI